MRIKQLDIKKYQVIREVLLENLSDFVVIAGPNGVGKTKIKDSICHIFQNQGNPPPNSSVILQATNEEELTNWGSPEITLPNTSFWSNFSRRRKKINTSSRLIHIDSGRQIETIQFNQRNFSQVSALQDDEEEDSSYSAKRIRDRFNDICDTLLQEKQKLIVGLGRSAHSKLESNSSSTEVLVSRQEDTTKKFEDLFGKLLYPKTMAPIEPHSLTIQYYDEDKTLRSFSDLSSGEREVIVLSFDILLQNPTDSVIVIDEPELHLHPELSFRLVKVLKSIGARNQFFLFTHSADIIGNSFDTGIYFIRPKSRITSGNQAIKVDSSNLGDLKLIPNLRETIGMLSLGKKLLFVEGTNTSMDRNVFSSIAKTSKIDLAIIPSDGCNNINNMSLICDTLQKGVFGIDLFMVRDRDSITDEQVVDFTTKSGGKLKFLPFYHIENTFLVPEALQKISLKIDSAKPRTVEEIGQKLIEFAKTQINSTVLHYVKSEIRFKAGNFDATPSIPITPSSSVEDIAKGIKDKKDIVVAGYENDFSEANIKARVEFWKSTLESAISNGWSDEARKLFYGKSILAQFASWVSPTRKVNIAEEIINDESAECKNAIKPLVDIIESI